MRKTRPLVLLVCGCLGAALIWVFRPGAPHDLRNHPLVGRWQTEPGALAPYSFCFRADSTGESDSGAGHFRFHWRAVADGANRFRVWIAYDAGNAYSPSDGEREVEVLSPDTIRELPGAVLRRAS